MTFYRSLYMKFYRRCPIAGGPFGFLLTAVVCAAVVIYFYNTFLSEVAKKPAETLVQRKNAGLAPKVQVDEKFQSSPDEIKVQEILRKENLKPRKEEGKKSDIKRMEISSSSAMQSVVNYLGDYLGVRWEVVQNYNFNSLSSQKITLSNTGEQTVSSQQWALYFYNVRHLEPKKLKRGGPPVTIEGTGFDLSHVDGYLFKLEPNESWKPFKPQDIISINISARGPCVSRYEAFPNWYIASKDTLPRIVKSTMGENLSYVAAFDTKEKWTRELNDMMHPFSSQELYDRHNIPDTKVSPHNIIPTPVQMDFTKSVIGKISHSGWTWMKSGFKNVKMIEEIFQQIGISASKLVQTIESKKITIIQGDVSVTVNKTEIKNDPESYILETDMSKNIINIKAVSDSGAFYAVQSLLALHDNDGNIPSVVIKDLPRYGYRGMHLDVARNFLPKEAVMKLLDALAMYKVNKFHFHLSDDEAWRLEIPGLEELTEVGSRRLHDLTEQTGILPQLGSGPFPNTSGTGFYTVADYKEILQYAADRHIEVIPETDVPGHSHSILKAMEVRYNKFKAKGDLKRAEEFYLTEPADNSEYHSVQGFVSDALNPGLEATYRFIKHIVKTLKDLHGDVNPLKIFHLGGDEVSKQAWIHSPACEKIGPRKKMKEYFVKRVAEITLELGLQLNGWEDGFMELDQGKEMPFPLDQFGKQTMYACSWNDVWDWGGASRAYKLANNGYKVIMTQGSHLYFDMQYEPDPEERGLYWATRFTDTHKTFQFMPERVYFNIETNLNGHPISKNKLEACRKGETCEPLRKKENLVGVQSALWSETVRTPEQAYGMIFPRVLAMAERAWHKADWEDIEEDDKRQLSLDKDWAKFTTAVGKKELLRLDKMGITYRVPRPGAKYEQGKLLVNTEFPEQKIVYSGNGGSTWEPYDKDLILPRSGTFQLATLSSDGKRRSRAMLVNAQ